MKDEVKVAKELVALAREMSALGIGQELSADPQAVDQLAGKFLARLGNAKSRPIKMYGLEIRPSDTVEKLAQAWATVLLAQ